MSTSITSSDASIRSADTPLAEDSPTWMPRRLRLPFAAVILLLPMAPAFIHVASESAYQRDYWQHLNFGRLMHETGEFSRVESFTHTIAGQPQLDQPWLMQTVFYHLHRLGGFPLVQLTTALLYAAAFAVLTALVYRRSGNALAAAAAVFLALALGFSNLTVRPQALSILLFTVELAVLWCWPKRNVTLVVVGVVVLLWTNVHGAFVLGLILPGVFLADRLLAATLERGWRSAHRDPLARRYALAVVIAAVAMFANPNPGETVNYVFGVMSKSAERGILEWAAPSVTTFTGKCFFASIALALVTFNLSGRRLRTVECLLLVAFLLLGAKASRMVIWWGLALAPILAPHLAELFAQIRRRFPAQPSAENWLVNLGVASAVFGFAFFSTPWTKAANPLLSPADRLATPADEPIELVAFLNEHQTAGNFYSPMEWSSYLTWHLGQDNARVFVDPMIESYPDHVWNDYTAVYELHADWQKILDDYRVDYIVWNYRYPSDLPAALDASPAWAKIYDDGLGVAFRRATICPLPEDAR